MAAPEYSKYTIRDNWGHRLLRGLCSCLIPGTGQLMGGARKRGYALIGVTAAIVVALVLVVLLSVEDLDEILVWVVEPTNLLVLLILDVVLVAFRLYAVADAVWLRRTRWTSAEKRRGDDERAGSLGASGGSGWKMSLVVLGLLALFAFTVVPHVWVGYQYVWKFRSVLTSVFQPATTTTTTIATTTSLADDGATDGTVSASTTTTLPSATVDAGDDGLLTVLFLGADVDETREGSGRNDTTIVASLDTNNGRIALFSLPRNSGKLPLGETAQEAFGSEHYPALLNEIYGVAWRLWESHPELAPEGGDPGAEVLRDTASIILGIPIDYYAVVNMLGLADLVQALGGVDIYFPKDLRMGMSSPTEKGEFIYVDVEEGVNHLDGIGALAYARTRKDSSDYNRMSRQRCLIAALLDQTSATEFFWSIPSIMDVIGKNIRTDIPIDALQDLIELRTKLKTDEMITIGFHEPKYTKGTAGFPDLARNGWVLNEPLIQETVQRVLLHPEEVLAESDSLSLDSGDCWKIPKEQ